MPKQTEYTLEMAEKICNEIAAGHALRNICKRPGWPVSSTVLRWLANNYDFRVQYTLARQVQAEVLIDDMLEIADDKSGDRIPDAPDGTLGWEHSAVARARLQVDARKWLISKLAPTRYGEQLDVNVHAGVEVRQKLVWRKPE